MSLLNFYESIIKLDSVLMMGDFIPFDNSSCPFASQLSFLMESFSFVQHVSGPTHNKGHTLDLVFSLGLNIKGLCVVDSHVSDHCWIISLFISTHYSCDSATCFGS